MADSGGHMVAEALRLGAIPVCTKYDQSLGGGPLILADVQGVKDRRKWGHPWLDPRDGAPRHYCITQVLPEDYELESD